MDGSPRAAASRPLLTHVEPLRRRSGPPRSAALAALALPPPPGSTSNSAASKQSAPRPPPFRHTEPGCAPGAESTAWERDPRRALPGHGRAGIRAGRKVWRIKTAAPGPARGESAAAGARGGRGLAASPGRGLPTAPRAGRGTEASAARPTAPNHRLLPKGGRGELGASTVLGLGTGSLRLGEKQETFSAGSQQSKSGCVTLIASCSYGLANRLT